MAGEPQASQETVRDPAGRKVRFLLLGVPAAIVVVAAGLWVGGMVPPLPNRVEATESEAHAHAQAPQPPSFFEMPEIISNLNSTGRRPSFVKLRSKLELARPEDAAIVQAAMPRLLDLFQTYLREMRPEELRGSVGTRRLREELRARANIAVAYAGRSEMAPALISDVLFVELLVQ